MSSPPPPPPAPVPRPITSSTIKTFSPNDFSAELLTRTKQAKADIGFLDFVEVNHRPPIDVVTMKCRRCLRDIPENAFLSHESNHSTQILDNLYLGGERNAHNEIELKDRTGITHILNMSWEVANHYPDDFVYKQLSIQDYGDQQIADMFEEGFKFIDEALRNGGTVLVHCVQGISRSATIVCVYLMKVKNWSRDRAVTYVKTLRRVANPNEGFMDQLAVLERFLGLSESNSDVIDDLETSTIEKEYHRVFDELESKYGQDHKMTISSSKWRQAQ